MKWQERYATLDTLIGRTLTKVERSDDNRDNDQVTFTTDDGQQFRLYHQQDCCESVTIESVVGNLDDLVGSPITMADESINNKTEDCYESTTWTFYKFATLKGYVDIRWLGSSNGYYSEGVSFERVA